MTEDTKNTRVYNRLSNDEMLNAEGQREATLNYVVATASQTYQDRHRERTKRGIRAARERRLNAAATQALDNQNLGGWALIAQMIRSESFPVEDIANVARLWSGSWQGDVWPAVRRVRETFSDRLYLLDVLLKVLEKADLWNVAQRYINDIPDFVKGKKQ
jgi:hypothetical protein